MVRPRPIASGNESACVLLHMSEQFGKNMVKFDFQGRKRKRHAENMAAAAEGKLDAADAAKSYNSQPPEPPARLIAFHPKGAATAIAYGKQLAIVIAGYAALALCMQHACNSSPCQPASSMAITTLSNRKCPQQLYLMADHLLLRCFRLCTA